MEVDVLTHGVTRSSLATAVSRRGGYDVIHWSGHGDFDELELCDEQGDRDRLRGGELIDLLSQAGSAPPRLFFLAACLSGSFLEADRWTALQQQMLDNPEPAASNSDAVSRPSAAGGGAREPPGHRSAGVPQVVAMHYEVGDDFAGPGVSVLPAAVGFPSALRGPRLALARRDLMPSKTRRRARRVLARGSCGDFVRRGRGTARERSSRRRAERPPPARAASHGGGVPPR